MAKRFDRESEIWFDEDGNFASPPPDALNKSFDSQQRQWRFKEGHPKAGAFAPSPEPDKVPWSYKDDIGRWRHGETGEIISKSTAVNRNRNLERAAIFKGWAEESDLSYQDLQQKFKGIPTEEIRGEFIAIDPETGIVEYDRDLSDRVTAILEEIAEEFGTVLSEPTSFIDTP